MAAAHVDLPAPEWVAATAETELLRFTTAGSVDDGKSTLIGRLLYDSKGVYEDQLASARKATRNQIAGGLDLSLLTDGLRAEREQGITIDVAYRYFSTARRKFIIADTPGHEQYTRNMATGASTADLAIILIDARAGVLPQSRRHAHIATLLGIRKLVVAVNKMDLVDFREDVFAGIRDEFTGFVQQLGVEDARFIPISALDGDNVVEPSRRTPWYSGPCLLEYLETVPLTRASGDEPFRLPVQYVIRPDLNFRGFAGQIAAGTIRRGDAVTVLPSGRTSRVRSIVTWEGDLEEAFAPMSVTICLEDEVDVSRGDMLVPAGRTPDSARVVEAALVWMNEKPLVPHRPYLLKHTTQTVQARVREIRARVDVNTLAEGPAARLELNEIGRVIIEAQRPLFFDPYRQNRATGSFVLIDPITNETAAAGMIRSRAQTDEGRGRVSAAERASRHGHGPAVVVLPPGRQELAYAIERLLFIQGWAVCVIETPDHLRQAVDTAQAAGVAAIVVPSTGGEIVESSLVVAEEEADRPDAAAEIVGRLLQRD
jgi:sulfate adenylyltransferase large subunit